MTSPYKTYAVTLVAREHVSPSFVRITLAGDDLADCSPTLLDQRVKLLLGPGEALDRVLGSGADWYEALVAAGEGGPVLRTYTLVAVRPGSPEPGAPGEVDIDVAVHPLEDDNPAPGMRFASAAPIGTRAILVAGDRTVEGHDRVGVAWRPEITDHVLLVGDETALPAVLNIVSTLPAGARGRVVLEVPHAQDVRSVDLPPAMSIQWCIREQGQRAAGVFGATGPGTVTAGSVGAGPAGPATPSSPVSAAELLWDEVRGGADRQAWIAGEAGWVRGLRAEAKAASVTKSEASFMGYWKKGVAGS
ncbi:siderophore-interacting protein [Tessaracoccus sp. SD287]|uniref:siderophore-interacting protein n=1 Tax=Tessaracoccus sp. SD287 TaxID=2782008 RepID=UPI001A96AC48|nr:siderophore-interacting protein [Tessaracoccus sp. SD287]MBO1032191.1 siderophore-interacting protein [Tessaracoccus sp. SD287]